MMGRWLNATRACVHVTAPWRAMALLVLMVLVAAGCRARRGPAVPMPEDFTGILVLAAIFLGLAWLLLKLIRG